LRRSWVDTTDILAVPYDTPIPGYQNGTVNTLRLWKATATEEFNLEEFNAGDYAESVAAKNTAENISMVLYPNDANENGKSLRLQQQYLLASASLQDIVANWVGRHGNDFTHFAEKNCFQLNDTHPSVAVAELMRILMDTHGCTARISVVSTQDLRLTPRSFTDCSTRPPNLIRWVYSGRSISHTLPFFNQ
jgi:starch phosphorylase